MYKGCPMIAERDGDKIKLRDAERSDVRVRDKDVELVYEGPLRALPVPAQGGEFETAWEMTQGAELSLSELSELAFGGGGDKAACCLAARLEAESGLMFKMLCERRVYALSKDEREALACKQKKKNAEQEDRAAFLERARVGVLAAGDERFWGEVEALAYGRTQKSKIAEALKLGDKAENAHAWLLRFGVWSPSVNPHIIRAGHPAKAPALFLGNEQDDDKRIDLTDMDAFAVDNAWSHDPDDAVSWSGGAVWAHIADPASIIKPESPADIEASKRAATLYVPEGSVPMLPLEAMERFCLGLAERSRALSFKIQLDDAGRITHVDVVPSWVRVKRATYQDADVPPLSDSLAPLAAIAALRAEYRKQNGAVSIDIPEVRVWLDSGEVHIERLKRTKSASVIMELMLLVGEAAALWAFERGVAFPYYSQEAPTLPNEMPEGLAGEFAKRRAMKAGMAGTQPRAHSGIGLSMYAQAGSPLRRYGDLLGHEQIRAVLAGDKAMQPEDLSMKLGMAAAGLAAVRKAERQSELHWTIAWLLTRPGLQCEGVVVQLTGNDALVFIPELGLETRLKCAGAKLNDVVGLTLRRADIAALDTEFSI